LDTILFFDQTKKITKLGLAIGANYGLGGRDSLILANFISNSIERMVMFDGVLLDVEALMIDGKRLEIVLPMDL